jgi:hypothetical protein
MIGPSQQLRAATEDPPKLVRAETYFHKACDAENLHALRLAAGHRQADPSGDHDRAVSPAEATFGQAAGVAKFTKRAARHCKDDPPTASELSGAEVVLNEQCAETSATACP